MFTVPLSGSSLIESCFCSEPASTLIDCRAASARRFTLFRVDLPRMFFWTTCATKAVRGIGVRARARVQLLGVLRCIMRADLGRFLPLLSSLLLLSHEVASVHPLHVCCRRMLSGHLPLLSLFDLSHEVAPVDPLHV